MKGIHIFCWRNNRKEAKRHPLKISNFFCALSQKFYSAKQKPNSLCTFLAIVFKHVQYLETNLLIHFRWSLRNSTNCGEIREVLRVCSLKHCTASTWTRIVLHTWLLTVWTCGTWEHREHFCQAWRVKETQRHTTVLSLLQLTRWQTRICTLIAHN